MVTKENSFFRIVMAIHTCFFLPQFQTQTLKQKYAYCSNIYNLTFEIIARNYKWHLVTHRSTKCTKHNKIRKLHLVQTKKNNTAVKLWQEPSYEVASGSRNPKINLHRKQFVTVLFQSRAKANIVLARINYGPSVVATT